MPTYEYSCTSCGEHLEVVQSFRDDALTECPACAGDLRKVFGSIGVVFKGSGFYKTDSRKASSSSKSADTKPAESAKDGSSSTGSSEASGTSEGPSKSSSPRGEGSSGSSSKAAAAS